MALMSQPVRTNSVASQSSSSGWLGGSPCEPKSSAVLTIPVPKYCCQYWFTATRAGSGLDGSRIHFANPKRFGGMSRDIGGRKDGTPEVTLSPLLSY